MSQFTIFLPLFSKEVLQYSLHDDNIEVKMYILTVFYLFSIICSYFFVLFVVSHFLINFCEDIIIILSYKLFYGKFVAKIELGFFK